MADYVNFLLLYSRPAPRASLYLRVFQLCDAVFLAFFLLSFAFIASHFSISTLDAVCSTFFLLYGYYSASSVPVSVTGLTHDMYLIRTFDGHAIFCLRCTIVSIFKLLPSFLVCIYHPLKS